MSSFDFNSDSQQAHAEVPRPPATIGTFSKVAILGLVLMAGGWAAWGPVMTAGKVAWARHNVREARTALAGKEWDRAAEHIVSARKAAPEDHEVIRVIIEFLQLSGSDPAGLVLQLRLLKQQQALTEDEEILLGTTLAALGRTAEAREVYEKLTPSAASREAALKLWSKILLQEGHSKEASAVSRQAASTQPDAPETRLKQALEGMKSNFVEVRQRAHAELLSIASMDAAVAMEAVVHLTVDPLLTAGEARELLQIVDQHAHKSLPVRLGVVSALARLQPQQRNDLIEAEVTRFHSDRNAGTLEQMARWLALEKQHGRLIRLVPSSLAARSRELYPIIAQALAEEGRWQELKELLTTSKPPVSPQRVAIWLAEASSHLEPGSQEPFLLLSRVVEASAKDGNVPNLLAAANTAEKLNLVETAAAAYVAAAERAPKTASAEAVLWLQKAGELALVAKSTRSLMDIFRKLHELRPASAAFADKLGYLRLVLGVEIETVAVASPAPAASATSVTAGVDRVPAGLLRALAAYRLGDTERMREHVAELAQDASGLPAGQRAVVAGLLSMVGKADRAFQIAEKVPGGLILDEELVFLKKAL